MPDSHLATTWVETSNLTELDAAPRVSVLMIVYNHESYLAEAIESIVSQECDFPFEVIIGDDCSTDRSLEIALHFQDVYPKLVRVLHGGPNIGMNANSRRVRKAARGSLLAWCEGDDYWCDVAKLAMQERVFAGAPRVGAVHTDWVRSRKVEGAWKVEWSRRAHWGVPLSLLEGGLLHIFYSSLLMRTCTLMFRKEIADEVDASVFGRKNYDFGDAVTSLFITSRWEVAYLSRVTAVYRVSPGSILRSGVDARIRFLKTSLDFDSDARAFMAGDERYPQAYRWELLTGLLLWAIKGKDRESFVFAFRSLWSEFGIRGSLRSFASAVWMRRRL